MKKILTLIMILIFTGFAIFADGAMQTNVIHLYSEILEENDFSFKFVYAIENEEQIIISNEGSVSDSINDLNIGEASTLNFVIKQGKRVKLGDSISYTLNINVTPWTLDPETSVVATNLIGETTNKTLIENLEISDVPQDDYHNVVVGNSDNGKITLFYNTGITDADTTLVTFDTTWKNNSELVEGDYYSFLTLTYESE